MPERMSGSCRRAIGYDIRVTMTSRKRMEDSEGWRAVGRIEEGQSITDVSLFFGVHHSIVNKEY
ncbi:UNVERIFIED_CONTAM: hypothetical protein NCL1_32421 [Trichonephila clavipes]